MEEKALVFSTLVRFLPGLSAIAREQTDPLGVLAANGAYAT